MVAETYEWTPDRIDQAAKLWLDGLSQTQIGAKFGLSRNAVAAMIYRNRSKFETRSPGIGVKRPVTKQDKTSVANPTGVRKNVFHWTEEKLKEASRMWARGDRAEDIAAKLGVLQRSFLSAVKRYRDFFPARGKPTRKADTSLDPIEAMFEDRAAERYDLRQFQIKGSEPVAFIDLERWHCRFTLEDFETKSGPQTPCCGRRVVEGRYYCHTHLKVMRSLA